MNKKQLQQKLEQDIADIELNIAFREEALQRRRQELKAAKEQLQSLTKK